MRADNDEIKRMLKTARGQIDGVLKMIDEDRYCVDVSHQILAAGAILKKANKEVIKSHMNGCVRDAFDSKDEKIKDEKMAEVMKLMEDLSK